MKNKLKRIPFTRIIAILIAAMFLLPILFCVLWWGVFGDRPKKAVFGEDCFDISFENAPEGTLYLDPLIKLSISDPNYTEFSAAPVIEDHTGEGTTTTPVAIDTDSEITKLVDDGYVSMSLHFKGSSGVQIVKHKGSPEVRLSCDWFDRECDYDQFQKYCKKLKAAYVDENGRVLKITNVSKTTYDPLEPPALIADGDRLTHRIWDMAPWQYVTLYVVMALEPLSFIALIVFIILALINRARERKAIKELTDNERRS